METDAAQYCSNSLISSSERGTLTFACIYQPAGCPSVFFFSDFFFPQSIRADLKWLGWKPVQTTYSSDRFEDLHSMAVKLIKVGKRQEGRSVVQPVHRSVGLSVSPSVQPRRYDRDTYHSIFWQKKKVLRFILVAISIVAAIGVRSIFRQKKRYY